MNIDQAIDKARKLLALSTSDNPHESAQAAARAQSILDKYEISRAMLAAGDDSGSFEINEPVEDFAKKGAPVDYGKTIASWKAQVANVVAQVNDCRVYTSRNCANRTIEIVGRAGDVQKVRYLYAYLVRETERLCSRDGRGCGRTWRNNFRHGVVSTVAEALRAARKSAADEMKRAAGDDSRALVCIDKALARLDARRREVDAFCSANLRLRAGSSSGRGDKGAYARGKEAGREVSLGGARGALGAGTRQVRGAR
ncbi:MAG: DUF7168 domain-containing protein [Alphaproteobacteria bacterium]